VDGALFEDRVRPKAKLGSANLTSGTQRQAGVPLLVPAAGAPATAFPSLVGFKLARNYPQGKEEPPK
jgi:hypothetical protein